MEKPLLILFLLLFGSCQSDERTADLIIINGNIWTGNKQKPKVSALAVKNEKIVAIGDDNLILKWKKKDTEVINVQGKFISPGFIDCHVHFVAGGLGLSSVQLREAKTREEFARRIEDHSKTIDTGSWITGGEWDHKQWGGELPTKDWIDKLTPDHPVFVRRLDGHMALANSTALDLAGINKLTSEVSGGEIVRNSEGEPTGLLKDNAMNLVLDIIPPPDERKFEEALSESMNYVAANGVTSVHQMAGLAPEGSMEAFERAYKNGILKTRIYVLMPLNKWSELKRKIEKEGIGDEWIKIGGLKGFADGSLGSHTAAFEEPYTDQPTEHGIFLTPKDSLTYWIGEADKANLQVAIHAIGDEAIHFVLNTFEDLQKNYGKKDRRSRIEHAQHISPKDISRFAQLNVIPSMQPYHAIDDGRWAEKIIGPERIKTTYAFKSLFDTNATVAFGSDWFVAPPTPLEGIYAAVTRRTLDNKNPDGWVPEQRLTVEQALTAYTLNAAYASFDEKLKGSLDIGKLADFVILSEDITAIKPEQIRNVQVLQTYVGGKKVFDRN